MSCVCSIHSSSIHFFLESNSSRSAWKTLSYTIQNLKCLSLDIRVYAATIYAINKMTYFYLVISENISFDWYLETESSMFNQSVILWGLQILKFSRILAHLEQLCLFLCQFDLENYDF